MQILVYEHITGGGLAGRPLPASLVREGGMMRRALLDDLQALGMAPSTLNDARLPPPEGVTVWPVADPHGWGMAWREALGRVDAVWPIAPESGGVLEELGRAVLDAGRLLLGSRPEAVALAASKRATSERLAAAGLPTLPCRPAHREPPEPPPWVVKPDDGAGCEDTRLLADLAAWRRWRDTVDPARFVLQPYWPGEAASLSLLCRDGAVELLACNRQRIRLHGGAFHLDGCEPNALSDRSVAWAAPARDIAAAIPGLWGYVGVDLLYRGAAFRVLEVNPRLTLSYCGLGRASGINPAAQVLGMVGQ